MNSGPQLRIIWCVVLCCIFFITPRSRCIENDKNIEEIKTSPSGIRIPHCHYKEKEFEPGEILFSIKDCETWICRNDTLGYGQVLVFRCLTADLRDYPNFYNECLTHKCEVMEIDPDEPEIISWEPLARNKEKTGNGTLWTVSFY